jgi:hypothetical protein
LAKAIPHFIHCHMSRISGCAVSGQVVGGAGLDWTFLSSSANFAPGKRTGHFQLGGDPLLTGAEGFMKGDNRSPTVPCVGSPASLASPHFV